MEPIALGKYQLLVKLATGGMAEIYVARVAGLPGFEKIVVVKKILPQLANDREFIRMFMDEARIVSSLHHPNIVQMYDIGVVDGQYFFSMEYLHGEDVRTLMRALKAQHMEIPLEHALNIVIGASSGLHYAHDKRGFDGKPLGIVHRDVTPQNVFITYDGGVKLVDFGIAKASNRFQETGYGTLKGKIPYMSPEQAKAEPLDRRSDVYALGIMLYELTTRTRLYKGESEFAVLKQIVEGEIRKPRELRPDYPEELEHICMKALAKDRSQRYQSAEELQDDLEGFARDRRMKISAIALTRFMEQVFGKKLERWREAQAEGKSLVTYLIETEEVTRADSQAKKKKGDSSSRSGRSGSGSGSGSGSDPSDGGELAEDELIEINEGAELALSVPRLRRRRRRQLQLGGLAALLLVLVAGGTYWLLARGGTSTRAAGGVGAGAGVGRLGDAPAPDAAAAVPPTTPEATPDAALAEPAAAPDAGTASEGPQLSARERKRLERDKRERERKERERKERDKVVVEVGEGELRVSSSPSCEIMVDGKSRGTTPIAGIKLPAGKHRLQLVNSRFGIDKSFTVEVTAGGVTKKKYDFSAEAPAP